MKYTKREVTIFGRFFALLALLVFSLSSVHVHGAEEGCSSISGKSEYCSASYKHSALKSVPSPDSELPTDSESGHSHVHVCQPMVALVPTAVVEPFVETLTHFTVAEAGFPAQVIQSTFRPPSYA